MFGARGVRRGVAVAVAVALVAGATACKPILHPEFSVVEPPLSAASFVLLAGSGSHVVVDATAATGTVPGPGTWRVDRSDGTAVALPSTAQRISADGQRVLLTNGDLWVVGGIWPRPVPSVFSDDLTAMAFRDADGTIKTRTVATGDTRDVETGFPRPVGSTATPMAVSDDGDTVQYLFGNTVRTVDVATATGLDLVDGTSEDGVWGFASDDFALSAGGSTVAQVHDVVLFRTIEPFSYEVVESWVRLYDVGSGAVMAEYVNPRHELLQDFALNRSGDTAWVYQERWVDRGRENCPGSPVPLVCVAESRAVMIGTNGVTKTFSTGPNWVASFDTGANGRFLLLSKDLSPYAGIGPVGPVHVYDWRARGSGIEVLSAGETYSETGFIDCAVATGSSTTPCTIVANSTNGQMTDNGRLVATTSDRGGWYEYRTAP